MCICIQVAKFKKPAGGEGQEHWTRHYFTNQLRKIARHSILSYSPLTKEEGRVESPASFLMAVFKTLRSKGARLRFPIHVCIYIYIYAALKLCMLSRVYSPVYNGNCSATTRATILLEQVGTIIRQAVEATTTRAS